MSKITTTKKETAIKLTSTYTKPLFIDLTACTRPLRSRSQTTSFAPAARDNLPLWCGGARHSQFIKSERSVALILPPTIALLEWHSQKNSAAQTG